MTTTSEKRFSINYLLLTIFCFQELLTWVYTMSTERSYNRCSLWSPRIEDLDNQQQGDREVDGLGTDLTQMKLGLGQVAEEVRDLKHLTQQLHRVFESDHVNVEYVHKLMSAYKSNPADWRKFAKFDRYRWDKSST